MLLIPNEIGTGKDFQLTFIYLFDLRGKGREGKGGREGEKQQSATSCAPPTGHVP